MATKASWLRGLRLNKVALVDEGANQGAHIVLYKRKSKDDLSKGGDEVTEPNKEGEPGNENKNKPDEPTAEQRAETAEAATADAVKAKEAAEGEVAKLRKTLAEATGITPPEDTPEDIFKNIEDPVLKAHMESVHKQNVQLAEDLKKAREEQAGEVEKRLERETVEKLAPVTNRLPVEVEKFAPIFRRIEKIEGTGTEDAAEVLRVLTAANELAQKSLLGTLGSEASGEGSDAEQKLETLAKARATEKGESFVVAYDEVLKTEEGARLYAEAQAGVPAGPGSKGGAA